jgi:hypothetical protein
MLLWLYDLDLFVLAIPVLGSFLVVANGCMLLTRRWVLRHWAPFREIVNYFVSAVGVIYAVLLAMIAVAAWQNFTIVGDLATKEASETLNLFRDAEGLPEPERRALQPLLQEYVRVVIEREWPDMQKGLATEASNDVMDKIVSRIVHLRPDGEAGSVLFAEMFARLNSLLDLRRQRLLSVDVGLLPALWVVVLVGAVINIGLTLLVAIPDIRLNLLLTSSYALMVGLTVYLIFVVDHPLWGDVSVQPSGFIYARLTMERLSRQRSILPPNSAQPLLPSPDERTR